ncbi:MAG: FHA domain-containing protein [Planctomycetota bacterium]|jgi:pSer/pThr/pTyr-binding forkhead associated (FHA) protein
MEPYETIDEFLKQYRGLAKNVFLTRFYDPALVVSLPLPGGKGSQKVAQKLLSESKGTVLAKGEEADSSITTLIMPLVKSDRSPPGEKITLGRGRDNDLVIMNASVSRRHALFKVDPASKMAEVEDMGSSFGTEVEGQRLSPKEPVPVESGAKIVLGQSVHCTFLFPEDLYEYMKTLARLRGLK